MSIHITFIDITALNTIANVSSITFTIKRTNSIYAVGISVTVISAFITFVDIIANQSITNISRITFTVKCAWFIDTLSIKGAFVPFIIRTFIDIDAFAVLFLVSYMTDTVK